MTKMSNMEYPRAEHGLF